MVGMIDMVTSQGQYVEFLMQTVHIYILIAHGKKKYGKGMSLNIF